MVPHSWIFKSLEPAQMFDNILEIVKRSMANWKTEFTLCSESLTNVNIRSRIFEGDSLSTLLFVICMIPLTHVLHKAMARYTLEGVKKINHFLYKIEVFSQDICIKFGIKGCGVIITNTEKTSQQMR